MQLIANKTKTTLQAPTSSQRCGDVVFTSWRRHNVVATLYSRCDVATTSEMPAGHVIVWNHVVARFCRQIRWNYINVYIFQIYLFYYLLRSHPAGMCRPLYWTWHPASAGLALQEPNFQPINSTFISSRDLSKFPPENYGTPSVWLVSLTWQRKRIHALCWPRIKGT